jgi:hypothetical protein
MNPLLCQQGPSLFTRWSVLSLSFLCLWVPETKGRILEEIQSSFRWKCLLNHMWAGLILLVKIDWNVHVFFSFFFFFFSFPVFICCVKRKKRNKQRKGSKNFSKIHLNFPYSRRNIPRTPTSRQVVQSAVNMKAKWKIFVVLSLLHSIFKQRSKKSLETSIIDTWTFQVN